jgi:uncharacterized membrane protein YkoI
MKNRIWIVAAVTALALVGATMAVAASGKKTTAKTVSTSTPTPTPETPLTGDVATQAKAAALAAAGSGSTADFATTENDGTVAGAAYEVHVTKADGTHVTYILDKDFKVLTTQTGGPHGGHGGPGNGETPLTGDAATKAKAAAVAKLGSGSTAEFASTEKDSSLAGAAYEVHATKADGTHVEVILDASYAVLAVNTAPAGGPTGGPPGGAGPHGPRP